MRLISYALAFCMVVWGSLHAQTTISGVNPLSGGRTGFEPDSISGLSLWLDGSYGLTLDTTAGVTTVSQWDDRSGNAFHATQATKANQPLYFPNNLNGRTVLSFTGTPVFMAANGAASILTGNDVPHTTFMVVKVNVLSAGFGWAAGNSGTGTPVIRVAPVNAAANMIYSRTDDAAVTDNKTLGGGAVSTWYIESVAFAGTTVTVARNATIDTGNVNVGVTTVDTFGICAKISVSMTSFLNADVAEIIVYNRNLTALEINRITTYLNTKYKVF